MPADLYNPKHFLEPSTLTLSDLLAGRYFHVPAYQRDYAWTEVEVRQLWSDLLATVERSWTVTGMPVDHPRPHFFGPIVVQTKPDNPGTVEVMDGQQRLVTFSVLLSILVEYASNLADAEKRTVWTESIKHLLFVFAGGTRRARVQLGRSAEDYEQLFNALLTDVDRQTYRGTLPATLPPELRAMLAAYDQLRKQVAAYLDGAADHDEKLIRLIRTLIGLSLFLLMEVQEQGVAYEVFEGLNARGLELSQADLVKNKLFSVAEQQNTLEEVKAQWEAAYEAIRGQSMVNMPLFLQYHHAVFYGPVKATELYNKISSETLPTTTATDYAISVRKSAERLQTTLDAGAAFSDNAIRHIERIRDSLANRYALVLIIASTDRVQIDTPDYETVLRLAHHFAFRRFVIEDASLSTYANEITEAARGFAAGGSVAELASALITKSTDAAFKASFREASARTAKEGFYVCEMIEHYLGSNAGMLPNPQSPSQHLEHIFPQRPSAVDWPPINAEDLALVVNRLGNLLVLEGTINRRIKNKAYSFKQSNPTNLDYAHSALKMPHSLGGYEDAGQWTTESIRERQNSLADLYAVNVWSLT
jgi:Protein of unknown function DUF262/Protein of unknown function (DUF1524)